MISLPIRKLLMVVWSPKGLAMDDACKSHGFPALPLAPQIQMFHSYGVASMANRRKRLALSSSHDAALMMP